MCVLPACVFADYSSMSDDELKAEFKTIVAELLSRGIWDSDIIPAGFYIVGQSVPVGNYELTATKHGTIEIFPDMEHQTNNKGRTMYLIFDEGEKFIISLLDGMTVELDVSCSIKPVAFSW